MLWRNSSLSFLFLLPSLPFCLPPSSPFKQFSPILLLNSFLLIVFQRQSDVAANRNIDFGIRWTWVYSKVHFDRNPLLSILINKSQDPPELALEGDFAHGEE